MCVSAGGISGEARQYLCSSDPALNTGGWRKDKGSSGVNNAIVRQKSCIEAGNRAIVRATGAFIRAKHTIK